MPRYKRVIIKGDLDWEEDTPGLNYVSVYENTPEFTGILDTDGNPILKMPRPIGFGRDTEW